jgi:CTP:molybdopterin cytidylyltransferase MocA
VRLIIPAAGNGSRLGNPTTPKALVQFGRGSLISHIISEIGLDFDKIVIVTKPGFCELFTQKLTSQISEELLSKISYAEQQEPSVSLDAIIAGLQPGEVDAAVIVWCDQVGVSRQTVQETASSLDAYDVSIPFVNMASPYVWLDILYDVVTNVGRSRDGDTAPKIGLADVGVFGLSIQALKKLSGVRSELIKNLGPRELDFTYAIPFLTQSFPTKLIARPSAQEAIAVNSKLDLRIAKEALAYEQGS